MSLSEQELKRVGEGNHYPRIETGYGFNALVDIPVNPFVRGIEPISKHPYCTYAEVSITRSLRSGTLREDFKFENQIINLAGIDYEVRLPIKQVNVKSGVVVINGILFLVEEFPKGKRSVVRPLFLAAEDHETLLGARDEENIELFPRIELEAEQFESLTTQVFGQAVSRQGLSEIVEKFQQGDLTVKIGDRFLNPRLLEISQLSYDLRRHRATVSEVELRSRSIYEQILSAGAAPAELLEYASRMIRIQNFIRQNEGESVAAVFDVETQIENCIELLGDIDMIGGLPLRMQYILLEELNVYRGGFSKLVHQLLKSLVSEQNFEKVRHWQFVTLFNLSKVLVRNISIGLAAAIPDKLLELMLDRILHYPMLGEMIEANHRELDIVDKRFMLLAKNRKPTLRDLDR
jgi:hypothetical protein